MRGVLASYRWRRRLVWGGSALVAFVCLVVLAIVLPKSQGKHYQLSPTGTEPVDVNTLPAKQVRVTPAVRRHARRFGGRVESRHAADAERHLAARLEQRRGAGEPVPGRDLRSAELAGA